MNIDLRQLRHFIALIEHRNFTSAAQAMKLSQSAFSRSIQSLEQTIGTRLIDRMNQLEPTPKGLVVLEHARRLINQTHDLFNDIQQFNEKEAGEVNFGCGPAPAAWLMPQVIGDFSRHYPKVRMVFRVDNWQALGHRLMAEELDFIVADMRNFEFDTRYRVQPLSQHRWGFCCRSGHPLAAQEEITVEQFFSYPLAATIRPPNLHRALVQLSGKLDIRTSIECENGYSLLDVVRHSDAIGTTNHFNEPERHGLHMLKIAGLDDNTDEFYTHYGIIYLADARLSLLARKLIDTFVQVDGDLHGTPTALTAE
ncbi:LysR family transcriptional regulator [Pectobacterium sp. A5351]|uniref:LysR family transcriptional regulator n=1 Tax=Pectobacterium sp. A5351 TaxID=2914983 RepID=UPI00232D61D5|nr:LysR family transcriptional regulator [Pectobacterium sp. A5351]WCG83276.1 LysR family transcriptional regulator [Pectobacterium sp. A5351]